MGLGVYRLALPRLPAAPGWSLVDKTGGDLTTAEHLRAVSHVIQLMREQLDAPHRLRDIARSAWMSPFHFHRIFRLITTTTPGRFLTALRMCEAKRMLLDTTRSATEISVTVGYSSFGTFTTQFTRLVGIPPGRYRRRAQPVADSQLASLLAGPVAAPSSRQAASGTACGWVGARPDGSPGVAIVALYRSEIPAELPLACAVAELPGPVHLPAPATAGSFSVLVTSVRQDAPLAAVLTGAAGAGMCVGGARVVVPPGATSPTLPFLVRLRVPRLTDPPLLTAFPLLWSGYRGLVRPTTG